MTSTDVTVLGAGAAGCAVAYYLSKFGVKVTVIHRDQIGFGASGRALGFLNPLSGYGIPGPLERLAMQSYRLHEHLWRALQEEATTDIQLQKIPDLHLCLSEDKVDLINTEIDRWNSQEGFSASWLTGEEVRTLEPRIVNSVLGARFDENATLVNTTNFTQALFEAACRFGTRFEQGNLQKILFDGNKATGVLLDDRTIYCDKVVVALGAWSSLFGLGFSAKVGPLKGQTLHFEVPDPPLKYHVGGACQVVQKLDGKVWVTSTVEQNGFDLTETSAARKELITRLSKTIPAFTKLPVVGQTACLRPVAGDDMPVIGTFQNVDKLYLATGAGTKGILLSPAIGRATADLIIHGVTDIDISGCLPSRSVWN